MRRNRLKELETVYILGAGASYAISLPVSGYETEHTSPLDITFNSRLLDMSLRTRKPWIEEVKNKVNGDWIGIQDFRNIGLEEAIIKRLGNYELLKAIHPMRLTANRKSDQKSDNFTYINNISHLIVELLSRCRQNSRGYANRFAKHVYGSPDKRSKNRIITFNYDSLIDDVMLDDLGIPHKKLYFDRLKTNPEDSDIRRSADTFPSPYLLKLHGSVNWRIDSSVFKEIVDGNIDENDKPRIWLDRDRIPNPSDEISPLILPPLPYKPITSTSIFRNLWQYAYEYLHEAKRIVIVGYSCPQTDSFAMSMLSQMYNMELEEVIIVDKDSKFLDKYRLLMNGRIPKKAVWKYYGDFIDYIDGIGS